MPNMPAVHSQVELSQAQKERVQAHLRDLLATPAFSGSRRCQEFLRYVIEETLASRGHAIKETNIAVDVFERTSNFDAQSASVVRVTGGDVRKRLAQAYASGVRGGLRIELPVRSYQPLIQFLPEVLPSPLLAEPSFAPVVTPRRPSSTAWLVVGIVVLAGSAMAARTIWSKSPLDRLWQPFTTRSHTVLVSLATPPMLTVIDANKWLPLRPGESIPTSSLQEVDAAVGTGGALGGALFAEQLARRGQDFVLKFSNDISFADLKDGPTILVGNSRWARELTQRLRFRLTTAGQNVTIIDSQQPDRSWTISAANHDSHAEGYALVTRLLVSESGQPAMVVVGMEPRSTQAAVEFVARSKDFEVFAAAAPGWEHKNFQVLLHHTIHGNSSGSLNMIAMELW